MSDHLPIIRLHEYLNGPFISTSANISGQDAPESLGSIIKLFSYKDVALYNAPLGNKVSPSRIYNLNEKNMFVDIDKLEEKFALLQSDIFNNFLSLEKDLSVGDEDIWNSDIAKGPCKDYF